ncbi:MAG: MerR family DNA-binding protein [Dehalococcoidia bacterium]
MYTEKDLERLRVVPRAQAIGFSLQEIRQLLKFRENPVKCSKAVRALAERKREAVQWQRQMLEQMHGELGLTGLPLRANLLLDRSASVRGASFAATLAIHARLSRSSR